MSKESHEVKLLKKKAGDMKREFGEEIDKVLHGVKVKDDTTVKGGTEEVKGIRSDDLKDYEDRLGGLKDEVKRLKKIKKQQKKISKLEEERFDVINKIEKKKDRENKLTKHKKH